MKVHTKQVLLDHEAEPHYAIEIIGCKTKHYVIKHVSESGRIDPVDCKTYRTEDAARAAAEALGIEIEKVGNLWEII